MLKLENVSVKRGKFIALKDVSFEVGAGKTIAVVGESGAGKSTLIASILNLVSLASGKISWNDKPVSKISPALVSQEPRAAFNPVMTLKQSVLEPAVGQKKTLPPNRLNRLCKGLELPIDLLDRKPNEVSIGQAQRVGIMRALIASSPLILFDEPLSALDAVTQKHTARLISDLQKEERFAALIVTHDLGYAAAFADDIIVLKTGCVEEYSSAEEFIQSPKTQYGQDLRNAAFALGALERAS